MLSFATTPFEAQTELSGHATVQLHVSSSEHDASVFVYLSEVDASGRSWYIAEGSFSRQHAKHMQPGVPEAVQFALLPVSWTLQAGSRLRVAIAGTDADHFAQVPHGRPPRLGFTLGGEDGSFIELPLRQTS